MFGDGSPYNQFGHGNQNGFQNGAAFHDINQQWNIYGQQAQSQGQQKQFQMPPPPFPVASTHQQHHATLQSRPNAANFNLRMGHPLSSQYPEVDQYQQNEVGGLVMDTSQTPDLALLRDPTRARRAFQDAERQYLTYHQMPPAGNKGPTAGFNRPPIPPGQQPVAQQPAPIPPDPGLYQNPPSPGLSIMHPPVVFRQPSNGPIIPVVPGNPFIGPPVVGSGFKNFIGYPLPSIPAPANLSCYEVCQQWPNSLDKAGLDAFLQRNWSAKEIATCYPPHIQAYLEQRDVLNNPTFLTNRRASRRDKVLIPNGDWDPLIRAKNTNPLREDGRPPQLPRMLSANEAPTAQQLGDTRARRGAGQADQAQKATVPVQQAHVAAPAQPGPSALLLNNDGQSDEYENYQGLDEL